jgi:glycosyltransferase involved in cell wall biosynthesis
MPDHTPRIGIDCRLAGQRHAGIGRYIENLVRELLAKEQHTEWVLFFSDQEQADQVLLQYKELSGVTTVVVPETRHYSISEQFKLPQYFEAQHLDLLHVPHFNIPLFYNGKIVVTIHDLLWHEYRGAQVTTLPKWKYWPKYIIYRYVVSQAVRRALKIFVPAQTVAHQVTRYYPEVSEKIVVTSEGVEQRFFGQLPKEPTVKKQIVYLGSLYPHKNVKVVLDALKLLPEYKLLLVSARTVFADQVKKYIEQQNLTQQVQFLGYLSDQEVAALLQASTALVQPSRSEGFGLTGLEAMAAGTPVIASDIPIFHEVYKTQAFFFDPNDPESFATALHIVESTNRKTYQVAAQEFARSYQWSVMADTIAKQYLAILNTTS